MLNMVHNDWNMIGHQWAVDLFIDQIKINQNGFDNISHAYLFTGPQGIGRRTLALRFAQALNCPSPISPGIPCRKCRTCRQIEEMRHPDINVIQSEKSGSMLKVDQIRDLQHNLALAPYESHYRMPLILRFEEAHPSAANALLKSLEEPPPHVILCLTANSAEDLLPTIVSRCQVIRLRPLRWDEVQTGLVDKYSIPADQAETVSRLSNGRPGFGLRMIQESDWFDNRKHWLDKQIELIISQRSEQFSYVESIADFRNKSQEQKNEMSANLRDILLIWLSFWRDVMLCAASPENQIISVINLDYHHYLHVLAQKIGLHEAWRMVNNIERTIERLDRNVNARMAVELLLLDLPRLTSL
jgi:DNA polymerase III subunit delta'